MLCGACVVGVIDGRAGSVIDSAAVSGNPGGATGSFNLFTTTARPPAPDNFGNILNFNENFKMMQNKCALSYTTFIQIFLLLFFSLFQDSFLDVRPCGCKWFISSSPVEEGW